VAHELKVSQLRRIQPKRNLDQELVPLFAPFYSLYERVMGDPHMIKRAWALPLADRLTLIGQILRGRTRQIDAPPSDQKVPAVRRTMWAEFKLRHYPRPSDLDYAA
jgi:hypothetical protein